MGADRRMGGRPVSDTEVYSVQWLLDQQYPPTRWIIEDLLPEGMSLLVARSKIGKSWLMLMAAMAIGWEGGTVLSKFAAYPGEALYLDLELPAKRTQRRVQTIIQGQNGVAPEGLHLANSWPPLGSGGIRQLRDYLAANPRTRLVVIDTIAKLWPREIKSQGRNAYHAEYELLSQVKRVADDHGVAIMALHHQNKVSPEDPLDRISGTAAMPAVADSIWILERRRAEDTGTLYVTGREVRERTLELRWDALVRGWMCTRDPLDEDRSQQWA